MTQPSFYFYCNEIGDLWNARCRITVLLLYSILHMLRKNWIKFATAMDKWTEFDTPPNFQFGDWQTQSRFHRVAMVPFHVVEKYRCPMRFAGWVRRRGSRWRSERGSRSSARASSGPWLTSGPHSFPAVSYRNHPQQTRSHKQLAPQLERKNLSFLRHTVTQQISHLHTKCTLTFDAEILVKKVCGTQGWLRHALLSVKLSNHMLRRCQSYR